MSHFKAKMRQILFPASVRSSVRLCLDTVDESHRRRHGVTAAIVVDVVGALRQCVSSSVCPSFRSCQTPSKRRTDGRPSLRWSLTLSGYAHVQCICATLWCHCHTAIMKLAFDLFQTCCSVFLQPSVFFGSNLVRIFAAGEFADHVVRRNVSQIFRFHHQSNRHVFTCAQTPKITFTSKEKKAPPDLRSVTITT